MPQVVKKRRSGWAVLAVGALVASLFAVGVAPAGAAEIQAGAANTAEPSKAASQTACVGDATTDRMFSDVPAGHDFEGAVNCIAYYDITKGTGDGSTFSPGDNVSRWQMALFLSRAADAAGAPLGMAADQGFADIGDAPDEAQDAINDLADAGIMSGASGTDFDPHGDVTRADMAGFLVRLLARTAPGVVQVSAGGSVTYGSNKQALSSADLDHFADARSLPRSADNLISAAYELGITKGTGDGSTFSPSGTVDRGQMAAFITRTLNHTNLRPEGISAQKVGSSTVRVAVRDADLKPVLNAWVDGFSVSAARAGDAFNTNDDGDRTSCTRLPSALEGSSSCQIDRADALTDGGGNAEFDISTGDSNVAVWVWTGDLGDRVSASTDLAMVTVTPASLGVVTAAVSDNLPKGAEKARFGDTVTITVQLQDANGDPGGPDGNSYVYAYSTSTYEDGRRVEQSRSSTLAIGADGSASFTISLADPGQRATDDNTGEIEYTIVQVKAPRGITLKGGSGSVTFDDDQGGTANVVTVTTDGYDDYRAGGSSTVVSVNVIDVYGDPVSRQSVQLGCGATSRDYTTNSDGNVRIPQTWREGAGTQSICAIAGGKNSGPSAFHWLGSRTVGSSGNGIVLAGDADRDEVVVSHGGEPVLLYYDDNDRYSTQTGGAVGLGAFEKALGADYKDGDNNLTLTWRYYDVRDPSDITEWSLDDVPTVSSDAPYITAAVVQPDGGAVTLTFSEALDLRSAYTARTWQFTVTGSVGGEQDVITVTMLGTIDGSSAQVRLVTAPRRDDPYTAGVDESTRQLTAADTVDVSYDPDATAPVDTHVDYDDARQLRADEYPDLSVLYVSHSVRNDIPPVLAPRTRTPALPDGNPVVVHDQLTLAFNAALSSSSVPAASQFTVEVQGLPADVTDVDVNGTAVTLTLASSVATANYVQVSYEKPATGSTALHAAVSTYARVASIDEVPVTVIDAQNVTPPVLVMRDTNVDGNTVTLSFDRDLSITSQYQPDESQFLVNDAAYTADPANPGTMVEIVSGFAFGENDASVVVLTLVEPVTAADAVSITYSHIAVDENDRALPEESQLLRDATGDAEATPRRQPVREFTTAIRNATPPVLMSATQNADKVTFTFNARLDPTSLPTAASFSVTLRPDDSLTIPVDESLRTATVRGTDVVLILATAITAGETMEYTYTAADGLLRSAQSQSDDGGTTYDALVADFTTGADPVPAVMNLTPPVLVVVEANTAVGNDVTVRSNGPLAFLTDGVNEFVSSSNRGYTSQFTVTVVGVPRLVTRVAVANPTENTGSVTLTIGGAPLVAGAIVVVTYAESTDAGYRLKSLTDAELVDGGKVTVTATEPQQ